ncbi:MAG: metallophosphoesterase [Muribaculaceae bacterium]|nr:metallophosphoesterase [Muribaculaceae bacterium]
MRLPLLMIFVLFIFAVLIDIYILKDLHRVIAQKNRIRWQIGYLISMLIGYGLLIAVMCMPVRAESSNILPVMWLLYSFLTIYIGKTVYVIFSLIGRLFSVVGNRFQKEERFERRYGREKKKRYIGCKIGFILGIASFFLLWWGVFFTRREIVVNRVDISSTKLPASFNGFKIVQFSDAHVGTWGNDTTFISKLVDRINDLKPDLIVFTGDIVNRRTEELRPFLKVLSRLKAKDGVYSVLGNHDYGDYIDWSNEADHKKNNELLARWEKEMGWKLLNNERAFVKRGNDSIVILGVENWGEPPFPEYGRLKDAYPLSADSLYNLNDSRFKVLLTHNPEHWSREVIKISNIDLSLSGHTHAMQMMISLGDWKWSPSVFKYSRWGGLYQEKNASGEPMNLYVNIGSGEVGMPSRIGSAYPEITEIILHRK